MTNKTLPRIIYHRTIKSMGAFAIGDCVRIEPSTPKLWFMRGATYATIVGFGNWSVAHDDGYYMPFARVVLANGWDDITPQVRRWWHLDYLIPLDKRLGNLSFMKGDQS